jgi:hypothetical protein
MLRSVHKEFHAALSDNDADGYVMMIEETNVKIEKAWFMEKWAATWARSDQNYPRIDANAPPLQEQGFQHIPNVRGRIRWYGEIGPPSERTDARASGDRSLFVSLIHLGNLVWRVRKALEAMNAADAGDAV